MQYDAKLTELPKSLSIEQEDVNQFRLNGISFPPAFKIHANRNPELELRPTGRVGKPVVVKTESEDGVLVEFRIALVRLESKALAIQTSLKGGLRDRLSMEQLSHKSLDDSIEQATTYGNAAEMAYNKAIESLRVLNSEIARLSQLVPQTPIERNRLTITLTDLSTRRKNVIATGKRFRIQFNKNVARLKDLQQAYSILTALDQQVEISVELLSDGEGNSGPLVIFGNRPEIGQSGPESTVR